MPMIPWPWLIEFWEQSQLLQSLTSFFSKKGCDGGGKDLFALMRAQDYQEGVAHLFALPFGIAQASGSGKLIASTLLPRLHPTLESYD